MIAIGIGCRTQATADDIEAVVRAGMARIGLSPDQASGLFAPWSRREAIALMQAAERLRLPLVFVSEADMQRQDERVVTRSDRVIALTGVGSVAEAAALSGAGAGARLLLPRLAHASATCAIAESANP